MPSTSHSRPHTGHDRPNIGHYRPNTGHDRPVTVQDRPNKSHDRPHTAQDAPRYACNYTLYRRRAQLWGENLCHLALRGSHWAVSSQHLSNLGGGGGKVKICQTLS